MSDITKVLSAIKDNEPAASDALLPLVYQELRKLAADRIRQEPLGQSLDATALVHEAYLKLVGNDLQKDWDSRGHFFAAASEAMRRILINRARDKKRLKRGGGLKRVDLTQVTVATETPDEALLALDEAIEHLANHHPDAANIVKLKFYAGLSLEDAAATLGLTRRQGDRVWAFARAWLFSRLRDTAEVDQ